MEAVYTYLLVVVGLVLVILILAYAVYKLYTQLIARNHVFRITDMVYDASSGLAATQKKYQVNNILSEDFHINAGDVQMLNQIACGTYGEVYEGTWQGTSIAIKKLYNREKFRGETLKKFEKETLMMGKLRHPNVILFIGVVVDPQNLWIVTEFMGRGSLHDVIHDFNQKLSWHLVIAMAMDAARGMQYLHHFKPPIVHCDLKSKNILVDNQYNVKVCDFGMSKVRNDEEATNLAVGTIQWTAPEVIRDERHTEKADVYSFGIVLWELVSRSAPYKELNHLEIAIAVAYDCPPRRPPLFPDCPLEYTDVMQSCWSASPLDRPSFDVVLNLLKNAFHNCDKFPPHPFAILDKIGDHMMPQLPISIHARNDGKYYRDQKLHIGIEYPDFEKAIQHQQPAIEADRVSRASKTLIAELGSNSRNRFDYTFDSSSSTDSQDVDYPTYRARTVVKNHWQIPYEDLKIIQQVGNGSFGVVSKGIWRDTEVAVKVLSNQNLGTKRLEEFKGEVSMMCELRHPNVVLFMGACLEPPHVCLVTEFMPRGNMYDVLHTQSLAMDWIRILTMASDAARGMNYLHCWNPPIIHRDLKSSNLLVGENWHVKVSDFGMSRFKVEDATMSQVGTLKWTAPEILRAERYSEKVDIYSFGIILWEMLTREEPHANMNGMKVGMEVMKNHIRPRIPEMCPDQYSTLIQECWDEDPDLRPSFAIILHRLKALEANAAELKQNPNDTDAQLGLIAPPSVGSVKSKRLSSVKAVSFAESHSSKAKSDSTRKHRSPIKGANGSLHLQSLPSTYASSTERTASVATLSTKGDLGS